MKEPRNTASSLRRPCRRGPNTALKLSRTGPQQLAHAAALPGSGAGRGVSLIELSKNLAIVFTIFSQSTYYHSHRNPDIWAKVINHSLFIASGVDWLVVNFAGKCSHFSWTREISLTASLMTSVV